MLPNSEPLLPVYWTKVIRDFIQAEFLICSLQGWNINNRAKWSGFRNCDTSCKFWILDSWPLRKGPLRCPDRSVRNYHYTLHNIPDGFRSNAASLCFMIGDITYCNTAGELMTTLEHEQKSEDWFYVDSAGGCPSYWHAVLCLSPVSVRYAMHVSMKSK